MSAVRLRLLAALTLLGLVPTALAAQQGTLVSGVVTSEAGQPLVAVQVAIPTFGVGAITRDDGRYSFTVPPERANGVATVVARRIGLQQKAAPVTLGQGAVTLNFTLAASVGQIEGLVVTALGQTREKSQLGTAQQQLSNADINETRAQNVMQQVQGKVSGVQITGAGTQGGSTNIIIRGQNSIAGNNQPLFVVDGIPVSNYDRGGTLISGYDYGNAIDDLNPDDIETMTILKGPNAAALYGSRAANGVVVITTKRGRSTAGRIHTELNALVTTERPSRLWDFQNQYGQGATGRFAYVNGQGNGVNDGADQSWGPMLDGRTTGCVFLPGTLTVLDPVTGKQVPRDQLTIAPNEYDTSKPCQQFNGTGLPWAAHPDNVDNFFRTGRTVTSTIAVAGGTDNANARLSLGTDQIHGYVPENTFSKVTAQLTGGLQISSRVSASANIQYIRNAATNRPGTGYSNSTLEQFFWFGRQIDIDALRDYSLGGITNNGPPNREFNWNYNYHNNPFWLTSENPIEDQRDRFIGSVSATYQLLDWLGLTGRTGSDIFRFNASQQFASGNLVNADPAYNGAFRFFNDYNNENNSELLLTADRGISNALRFQGTLGGATRRLNFRSDTARTTGISVPGIYNVSNAAVTPTLGQYILRKATNSVYGSGAVTYNNWWTVEATARNDWSSTLPTGQNSYFYPSVNTSMVLTDWMPGFKVGPLTYAKIRGSVAQVGNDAEPYQLVTTYTGVPQKYAGLPQFTLGSTLANAELKPEITRSDEAGIEVGFYEGRASLDATVYNKVTRNQIFNITVSPTIGFGSKAINAGRVSNHGFEALFTVVPVQTSSVTWTSTFNYSHNRSKVDELFPGINSILLGQGIFAEVQVEARAGQPYGNIFGQGFARDSATGRILTSGGVPIPADNFVTLGNIQADWTGGWNNAVQYKNLTFGILVDIRRGGKIVSETNSVGVYSGVLTGSLRGREIDWNNPGIKVDGIDVDTGLPNEITVTAEKYYQSIFPTIEPYVYDASYVKLRELRIGFDFPQTWANRFSAQNVSVAITGRNLKIWTDVPNIDPEFAYSSGNFQGIEYAIPSNPRSIGFNVRVTP